MATLALRMASVTRNSFGPKALPNPDCIAGHDFREKNDAEQRQKTRLPEAGREGVNVSLVGRKQAQLQKSKSRRCACKVKVCREGVGRRRKPNPGFVWGKRRRPELKNPALKVVKRGVES